MIRLVAIIGFLIAALSFATASAAQEYRVQPGDVLNIEVAEDESLDRLVLVAPDGRISFPGTSTLNVRGQTVGQIQAALASRLTSNFVSRPNVFVGLASLAPREEPREVEPPVVSIFVMGEATNVGRVELEPGTTLLQAFAQFGGFTNFAATKRIQLRRGNEVYIVNYDAMINGLAANGSSPMHEGDVIVVPQRRLFE